MRLESTRPWAEIDGEPEDPIPSSCKKQKVSFQEVMKRSRELREARTVLSTQAASTQVPRAQAPKSHIAGHSKPKAGGEVSFLLGALAGQVQALGSSLSSAMTKCCNTLIRVESQVTKIQHTCVVHQPSPLVTRMKLGGLVDEFFAVVGPLHNHRDGQQGYSAECDKCRMTQRHLSEAIAQTDVHLLHPGHRLDKFFQPSGPSGDEK